LTSVLLGHGTATTTARGWQGELWDSEDDTCDLLQEVLELEVLEVEVERLMRKIVKQKRDGAM